MIRKPQRGEVYWVDFDPARGSEQAGHRPAVVISVNSFNSRFPTVVVAAVTTTTKRSKLGVLLPAGQPCEQESMVMPWQVLTVDQSRLDGQIGALNEEQVRELNRTLMLCWGLT
ncbi:type II toxin-antitoxin system PemK/MazF family toxin [Austwickia chelonae]|uniref:type II toxin-antitoxin system PemK/MazF family toxin n=1 Tax=Austwickia chelonae TaxID=100225 RepID=UPI0013C35FA6|nr:type II toxin-antitoxin system PemK/MazF family toxin [Austwickia chelonae]